MNNSTSTTNGAVLEEGNLSCLFSGLGGDRTGVADRFGLAQQGRVLVSGVRGESYRLLLERPVEGRDNRFEPGCLRKVGKIICH